MTQANHIPHGYKSSPLGNIPDNWEVRELGSLFDFKNGLNKEKEAFGKGTPIVNYTDVYKSNFIESNKLKGRVTLSPSEIKRYEVRKGDVFFTRTSETIEEIGLSAVVIDDPIDTVFSGFILRARPINNKLSLLYKKYCFSTFQARKEIIRKSTYTTRALTNGSFLSDVKLFLPPITEQTAIADLLSTWDNAVQVTTQLIAKAEQRKKWLMQQLLSGKKRLKGFNSDWKEYSYDKLLKVVKRPVEWNDEHLYKLISVRRRSGGIFFREALYGHQIKVKGLREALEGDFLFSKMQIVHGASALVTKEFKGAKISGSYIAVVEKNSNLLNINFFNWYSQTPYFYHQTYVSSYGVHIEKMTFDFESFLSLGMKLPSYEEQTAIAAVLQTADREIRVLKIKVEKLNEEKSGLMQQLLTGKKRISKKNKTS